MIKKRGLKGSKAKVMVSGLILGAWFFAAMAAQSLAAPVGNPADPVLLEGNYPTKFDLQAETVLNRKLSSRDYGAVKLSADLVTGKFSYYIGRKLDIYGLFGICQDKAKSYIDNTYILTTKLDASWGFGASYIFHEFEFKDGIVRLGADAKYRQFDTDTISVNQYRTEVPSFEKKFLVKEWQGSLGASYQYKKFVPYCGLKYSDTASDIRFSTASSNLSEKTLRSKNKVGIFYGLDILLKDNLSLNMEERFIDENALDMGVNFRF